MIRDYGFGTDTGQADSKFGISYEEILEKAGFIKSAGAYGQSMASRYNLHDLPRSVYSDDLK